MSYEFLTKEELQIKISESQARVTAYNAFVEILTEKLAKVNAGQPVTFRPESGITESSTKEEKVSYLEAAIKNNEDALVFEQQVVTDCTQEMERRFPEE